LGGGCYELLQRCCGLVRDSYIGVFDQIYNSSYFGAVIRERGPNFVFLLVVSVITLFVSPFIKFLE
jgi:hypothetical protein